MRWFLLLALLARPAWAQPWVISSGDVVSHSTGTATDLLDWTTIETATDADVQATECVDNSYRCSLDTNGGSSSSRFGLKIDLASGERGGWEMLSTRPFPQGTQGTLAFKVHWPSGGGVSAERVIAQWNMANGQTGCKVALTSAKALKLYYQSTLIGTADSTLTTDSCTNDPSRGCTADTDCSDSDCGATGAGGSGCSTTTGALCFWPTLELVQVNYPSGAGDQVACRLWINGQLEIDSDLISAANLDELSDPEVGGVGTESATAVLAFDDLVVSESDRVGRIYLHWMTISAGILQTSTESTCGSGTTFVKCVDDYGNSAVNDYRVDATDDYIRANRTGKGASTTRYSTQPTSIPSGATITAVATPVVGQTAATNGTWVTRAQLAQCADAADTCESVQTASSATDLSHGRADDPILTGFPITESPPSGGGGWSLSALATLGTVWSFYTGPGSSALRYQTGGAVVMVRYGDDPPTPNLTDHNIGTEDGIVTVVEHGDSTACGTGAAECQGGLNDGLACNQETYCSWDSNNRSKPVGGCTSDTGCRTCGGTTDGPTDGRRLEFNNGAGYLCTSSTDCDLGTCSGGTCTGDTDVSCSVNADCQLGTCATTATCEESCPDNGADTGSCPSRYGYPYFASFTADRIINCCQDGSTTGLVRDYTFLTSLYGRGANSNCTLVSGDPGKCTCSSNSECQTTSGGTCDKATYGRCSTSVWTSCTVDGNCPNGETCLGLCTASDNGRDACTGMTVSGSSSLQCASSRVCAYSPADYVIMGTGVNDMQPAYETADCEAPYTTGGICDNCTETACVTDAGCSAISAASQCLGLNGSGSTSGTGCWGRWEQGFFSGTCSTDTASCRVDSDCRSGQVCTGETGGPEQDGVCTCDADADCDTGFVCSNSMCRRSCTTNAQCGSPYGVCDGTGVCRGQCTCPCDAVSCAKDEDCPTKGESSAGLIPARTYRPKCVAGKCNSCTGTRCASSSNTYAYKFNYARFHTSTYWARQMRTLNSTIITEAARTTDLTPPLLIPVAFPDGGSRNQPYCTGSLWTDLSVAAKRNRLQLHKEFEHVIDVEQYVDSLPDNQVYVDLIHPGSYGALKWQEPINWYMAALNSCVTGTRSPDVRVKKYCQNLNGTWDTENDTCDANSDCTGTQVCVQRVCTVDDNSASGCPGTPTCYLE